MTLDMNIVHDAVFWTGVSVGAVSLAFSTMSAEWCLDSRVYGRLKETFPNGLTYREFVKNHWKVIKERKEKGEKISLAGRTYEGLATHLGYPGVKAAYLFNQFCERKST